MPGWITVSALVKNVTNIFSPEERTEPPKLTVEKDPGVLLAEVNRILSHTDDTLKDFHALLPPFEYERFLAEHRVLRLNLRTEEINLREFNELLVQHGRISSQPRVTKEAIQVRAVRLLNTAEAHQSRVVSASQRVATLDLEAFPDEEPSEPESSRHSETDPSTPTPATAIPSCSNAPLSGPTPTSPPSTPNWIASLIPDTFSVTSAPSLASSLSSALDSEYSSAQRTTFDDNDLVVAVAHIRVGGTNAYQRIVSVNDGSGPITIVDPQLHLLSPEQLTIDDRDMRALHRAAERWCTQRLAMDID
ncbi:hypothetical protein RhiJN_15136 [Ceratobasidium sp. AG-Ba]|nr:hypothetical protein RhiJN_15136 [Ceratobasidium sp. AG-Ba]